MPLGLFPVRLLLLPCYHDRRGVGWQLDIFGQCCNQPLDACGICGGNGVALDVQGRCCTTPLSVAGLCCDVVDDCGVCNGVNACKVRFRAVVGMAGDVESSPLLKPYTVPFSQ